MTTSWYRRSLWHLPYSRDNVKTVHTLTKCCRCKCHWIIVLLQLIDSRNSHCRCAVLLISFTEVVGSILPSQLCQFVKLHLLLRKPLHALQYHFGDCAHHPAGFIIFAQLALLCLFIFIFSILLIIRTCKITQTGFDSNHHLLKSLFRLPVCQSRMSSILYIFLLLLNRFLWVFNSLSCPSSFSLNKILNPFLFLFIAWEVRVSLFLGRKLLFESHAAQYPKGSDSCQNQTTLPFIHLMTSLGGPLCRCAISACRKWWKVLFQSIDYCSLCWLCCWARCWMLQDMDNMEASCVFYVKVGTFTHPEQSKISLLTVNISGLVGLTVHYNIIGCISFMY